MWDGSGDFDRRTPSRAAITRALQSNRRLRDKVTMRLSEMEAMLELVASLRATLGVSSLFCGSGRRAQKCVRSEALGVVSCPPSMDGAILHRHHRATGAARMVDSGEDAALGGVDDELAASTSVTPVTPSSSLAPALVVACTRRAADMWGPVATSVLLDELRVHNTPFLLPHNDTLWAELAQRLRQYGFHWCTPLACYRQVQFLLVDRCAFTPKEDRLICQFVASQGRRWWALARCVYDTLRVRRSAFQLAQRYRDVMRVTLFETRLTSATVWRRVEHWVDAASGDYVRLTILANAACGPGELALQPLSVRQAMDNDVLRRLGSAALYWKVFAVLNRINISYPERLEHFVARAAARYEQLTLATLAQQLHCTEDKLRERIKQRLLQARRQLHLLNFDKLSIELFGHTRCSRVIFFEACRLRKEDVVTGSSAGMADVRGGAYNHLSRPR